MILSCLCLLQSLKTVKSQENSKNCKCGVRGPKTNRVVGGQETGVNEFPMMAAVIDDGIGIIKCGGVIISKKHVLTAAHCMKTQKLEDTSVLVGEHDVSTGTETSATKGYKASSVTIHPGYSADTYDNDIAIITVDGEIEFSDRVGPVCLPYQYARQPDYLAGKKVTVLGWGSLFPGGPDSKVLQKAELDVLVQTECESLVTATERQMCTLTKGKGACQGDSGGPTLFTDPTSGLIYNVGIVSNGQSCASPTPGIDTRVSAYLKWIEDTTQVEFCKKLDPRIDS